MKVIITFKYELIKNSRAHNWPAKRKATVRKWSKNRKLRSLYPVVNIKSVCVLMSEETVRSAWYDTCTEREANVIRSGSELGDVALYVLFSIWYSCFPDGDSESKTWFVCVCVCVYVCVRVFDGKCNSAIIFYYKATITEAAFIATFMLCNLMKVLTLIAH